MSVPLDSFDQNNLIKLTALMISPRAGTDADVIEISNDHCTMVVQVGDRRYHLVATREDDC